MLRVRVKRKIHPPSIERIRRRQDPLPRDGQFRCHRRTPSASQFARAGLSRQRGGPPILPRGDRTGLGRLVQLHATIFIALAKMTAAVG